MRTSSRTATTRNRIVAANPVGPVHLEMSRLHPVCLEVVKVISHSDYQRSNIIDYLKYQLSAWFSGLIKRCYEYVIGVVYSKFLFTSKPPMNEERNKRHSNCHSMWSGLPVKKPKKLKALVLVGSVSPIGSIMHVRATVLFA